MIHQCTVDPRGEDVAYGDVDRDDEYDDDGEEEQKEGDDDGNIATAGRLHFRKSDSATRIVHGYTYTFPHITS